MSFDITPRKARRETDENLTLLANQYRSDSGAYLVVANEIKRRTAPWHRAYARELSIAIVAGLIVALITVLFLEPWAKKEQQVPTPNTKAIPAKQCGAMEKNNANYVFNRTRCDIGAMCGYRAPRRLKRR